METSQSQSTSSSEVANDSNVINDTNPNYKCVFNISLLFDMIVTIYASYHWYHNNNNSNNNTNNNNNSKHTTKSKSIHKEHNNLILKYLCVYLLATISDWLQGPYIYALYDAYKFSRKEIATLFCAGYGSSMIFGSIISGMADTFGRRLFVLVYCIVCGISCVTKHINNFKILLFGRLLAGIAASLLYSVFEAWFIRAHVKASLHHEKYIAKSFSIVSYSNYIIAILAGLVSHRIVIIDNGITPIMKLNDYFKKSSWFELYFGKWDEKEQQSTANTIYYGGFLNSFDLAFACLILCSILALLLWEENYGTNDNNNIDAPSTASTIPTTNPNSNYPEPASVLEEKIEEAQQQQNQEHHQHNNTKSSSSSSSSNSLSIKFCIREIKNALQTIIHNKNILLCGLISSIFESSMYIFVFNWTPTLIDFYTNSNNNNNINPNLPFGLIFSTFMVCCMSGSSLFSIFIVQYHYKPEYITIFLLFISILCFIIMRVSDNITITYYSMNIFELCVGIYFPTMGTMKSKYVPEIQRSTIYSLFRIPLNLFVLVCFFFDWGTTQSFDFVIGMLIISIFLCMVLIQRQHKMWILSLLASRSKVMTV